MKEGIGSFASISAAFGPVGPIHPVNPGLIDFFEDVALDRTRAWRWHAEEWLFDDEASALAIAKETAVSGGR